MAFSRVSLSFLLSAVLRLVVVTVIDNKGAQGLPQFLVTNGRSKCFKVEIPARTDVEIHYEAPGFDFDALAPTYITLIEKPSQSFIDLVSNRNGVREKMDHKKLAESFQKHKPIQEEITEATGKFDHHTTAENTVVDLCVRSSKASPANPLLLHLRVEEVEVDLKDFFESLGVPRVPEKSVEHHWTFLETQLDRIEHEMRNIIREANYFKERDAAYHLKMDGINKSTIFWPMLHCFIIVVTGFTQANHIIAFFKKRRII